MEIYNPCWNWIFWLTSTHKIRVKSIKLKQLALELIDQLVIRKEGPSKKNCRDKWYPIRRKQFVKLEPTLKLGPVSKFSLHIIISSFR